MHIWVPTNMTHMHTNTELSVTAFLEPRFHLNFRPLSFWAAGVLEFETFTLPLYVLDELCCAASGCKGYLARGSDYICVKVYLYKNFRAWQI